MEYGESRRGRREMTARPPWLTCAFALITLACWFAGDFLTYPWPEVSDWLRPTGSFLAIVALLWLFACIPIPKPRSAPVLLATLLIVQVARMAEAQSDGGLVGLGFRIHASPLGQYVGKCRKIEFIENGTKRVVGDCERRAYDVGFPATEAFRTVIYDPAGNLLQPESQRPPGWKRAFQTLLDNDVAIPRVTGARHLFADFYLVYLVY